MVCVCMYMSLCVPHVFRNMWKLKEAIKSLGTGVTSIHEPPHGCWELKVPQDHFPQDQSMLLTSGPSLWTPISILQVV